MFPFYIVILLTSVALVVCLDIIHVVRTIFVLLSRRKRRGEHLNSILDVGISKSICLPFDLDIFMHMNNGNYLKHCDIARIWFWKETGVWDLLFKLSGSMTLGGSCNRYRRAITLFTKFTIKTRVRNCKFDLYKEKLR
ncbi:protein THEM6-like [Mercenaria mercenaria]|uniref:protein THEM6-like n=1 Tax=Mercenaria mercenaria TaxID=6596 RepID=UPI00234F6E04|nr:protein THEM6-like [Mercenaria mercenaria]